MTPLYSQKLFQMESGLGKMKFDTAKPEQITCHSTRTVMSSSQGDQRSTCFRL